MPQNQVTRTRAIAGVGARILTVGVIMVALVVIVGCSGGSSSGSEPADPTPNPPATSAAEPQTCDEVADAFIAINQEFLDELGDMSVEEFEALGDANRQGTSWPAFEKLGREGGILFTRAADELSCSDQDLLGEGFDQLTPSGPAGELWVQILGE
jgi:hypothetical protein